MLLRVRMPSGKTERVKVESDTSQATLEVEIQELGSLETLPSLFTDASFTNPFALSRAKHGDMVFVLRNVVAATQPGVGPPASAANDATKTDAEALAKTADGEEEEWRPPCDCGPRGMCPRCAPKEDKDARYEKELTKWKGKGMSMAVLEALEALKPAIKPQEDAHAQACCVDSAAGHAFQAYLGSSGFSQHRFGVCYGTATPEKEVEVHAIFEPPQQGDESGYALVQSEEANEALATSGKLAKLLGFRTVGIIFSARQRKAVLSGRDVVLAAEYASKLSKADRKLFVVIKVAVVSEAGETAFEAYQISDLAIELYGRGIFAPTEEQKANSGKVLCVKEVLVEKRDTKKVHTEFFLNNIPIKALENGFLKCEFPIENRELRPQRGTDLAASTAMADPFWKRISDFHLLLYLTGTFGDNDMSGIVTAIRTQEEIEEGYQIMIQSLSAS